MTVSAEQETFEFQTEAKQLLKLMVHSLYSNKEIFMRELISNASDACDKLRFDAISDEKLTQGVADLQIRVEFDAEKKTLSIIDNGIGMSRDEVIENIGTIAKSGTREFIDKLTGDQKKDSQLIGQFGVGFYSVFIVAHKVEMLTRKAGLESDQGVHWISEGEGSYTLENIDIPETGTKVILHVRDEEADLLDQFRLQNIIKKYSDHINLPIKMLTEVQETEKNTEDNKEEDKKEDKKEEKKFEWETVNQASALWSRPKKDISDEEYNEFYKTVSMDYEEPLAKIHSHVEGNNTYTTLFYIPKRAPFDMYDRDKRHGVKLYVNRVYIMDDAEHLMPNYLRFVRGVVDSDNLPLNVSREILQSNPMIDRIRSASVKKILSLLESMATNDKEKYATFWEAFGKVLKEGAGEDFANKDQIAKLFRFSSTHEIKSTADVSLDDYISRMKPEQKHIYFIAADSFAAVKNSPHLEVFRKKEIEVLLMSERVDEWMMSHMSEYADKKFKSVAKGDLDLGDLSDKEMQEEVEKAETEFKDLVAKMKEALGERVKEVRVSQRLTDSPACLIVEDGDMAISMQNLFKQAGHEMPAIQPTMEINPQHILVKRLNSDLDGAQFNDWAHILFDQSILSEGGQLEDPSAFVSRLNTMLAGFALSQ